MEGFKHKFDNFLKDTNEDKEFKDSRYYLDKETQTSILDIQEKKQELITNMQELLAKVDTDESIRFSEHARTVEQRGEDIVIIKKGGTEEIITKGDVLVAGMNGFDISLNSTVDRLTKKQFILSETTRRIKGLYNEQLTFAEVQNKKARKDDGAIKAYKQIAERSKMSTYESEQSGVLAEHMVESFMTRLIANNPHLPFTIEMADVYDDVRSKIDFKLHIKKYTRGVKIESGIDAGIQFTINQSKTEFKEAQIEKSKQYMNRLDKKPVDDILLVTMSINEIEKSLSDWNSQGKQKSIAGPAEHWSSETKKLVFTKMIEKLPEGILEKIPEELWATLHI